jgi:FlaA1/EpsC-like NDP-sugar epimerase
MNNVARSFYLLMHKLAIPDRIVHHGIDALFIGLSWWLAFSFRFNFEMPLHFERLMFESIIWPLLCYVGCLEFFGIRRQVWRFTGISELIRINYATGLSALLTAAIVLMLRLPEFPRSVLLLHPILVLLSLLAVRLLARWLLGRGEHIIEKNQKRLLLLGSLKESVTALSALRGVHQWLVIGIVSPIKTERGRTLQGIEVLGSLVELPRIARETEAVAALVVSAAGSDGRRAALMAASDAGLPLLTMPRADEWLHSGPSTLRRVELDDLLGRAPVALDEKGLSELMAGQTIMVTGAGGSIGSELCRQIARFGVARLICVDVSEFAVYKLEQELREAHPQMQGLYFTANVREFERLLAIAQLYAPAVVFHAAAYKHVPLMESLNEIEALRTNVLGTLNAARVAGEVGAQRFVLISTDKAVNPTNVMGASKRLAEQVLQAVADEFTNTHFVSVRFGNVLGSSGSVVPLFTEQIARGGPVTVTHPDIVRYFMTIPEAAQLVMQAGLMGLSRQIFVLDMGEPVKILDLARLLIRLSGRTEQDIPIRYTGLRPGEKLYEELLAKDETTEPTPHPKLRIAKVHPTTVNPIEVKAWIESAGPFPNPNELRIWLRSKVTEYQAAAH